MPAAQASSHPGASRGRVLRVGIPLALGSALGLGIAWLTNQGVPRARTVHADTSGPEDVAHLRAEVEALKRRIAIPTAMTQPPSTPPAHEPAANVGKPDSVPQGPPTPEARRAQERERAEAARVRMDVEIESQARDRAFERDVEEQLRGVYQKAEFAGTRLESFECRSTLCRVTSTHDTREAMGEFAHNAAKYPPFNTEVFYSYGEGESPVSTLYVSRPGASLPHDF